MLNMAATSSDLSERTAPWESRIQTWINSRDPTILNCIREDNLQTSLPANVLQNVSKGHKTPIVFLHILPRPVASNARLFTFWYWSPTCTRWPNVSRLKCPLTYWEANAAFHSHCSLLSMLHWYCWSWFELSIPPVLIQMYWHEIVCWQVCSKPCNTFTTVWHPVSIIESEFQIFSTCSSHSEMRQQSLL